MITSQPITLNESKQLSKMIEWANQEENIAKIAFTTFKQSSKEWVGKKVLYEMSAIVWIGNNDSSVKWKSISAKSETVTEAMKLWADKWQSVK